MPIQPTYPGVYIEEIPSGVRTIAGVATSVTAFIGRALRGPTDQAAMINSFGDFTRQFGGLWVDSMMSYAVRDFYQNGGGRAVVVRVAPGAVAATITLDTAGADLILEAVGPGIWGNNLQVSVDYPRPDLDNRLFNLTITEFNGTAVVATETFANVSTDPASSRYVANVLAEASALVRVQDADDDGTPEVPAQRPTETSRTGTGGADAAGGAAAVAATLTLATSNAANNVVLAAATPGVRGNNLRASVNYRTNDRANAHLFNLTVSEVNGAIETFNNVSNDPADVPRFITTVLSNRSMLVRIQGAVPAERPLESPPAGQNGTDGNAPGANDYIGDEVAKSGLSALLDAEFNLLCIPPPARNGDTAANVYGQALTLCGRKRAMLLVDPPAGWGTSSAHTLATAQTVLDTLGLAGDGAKNAALYFPRIRQIDPLRDGQTDTFVPCGVIAGIMARTDASRGVWKAPAGLDASLNGVQGLQLVLNDAENGILNPLAINCLRQFPVTGRVVWGARTLRGADQIADIANKEVAVRRTTLFIEESLYRGMQWVVFEPNDEPLWAQIRLNVGAFMHNLFRQGAFQGNTPRQAYSVKCDGETTTQNDINRGIVNVEVGFLPLRAAEFVFIKIKQLTGQTDA